MISPSDAFRGLSVSATHKLGNDTPEPSPKDALYRKPAKSGKRVAIVQPCYIPWKGYFDIIASVDEFILFDDVQFVKRTWFNRNCIKTPQGLKWLSVPVKQSGRRFQTISETEISERWADRHFDSIRNSYRKADFFGDYSENLRALYESADRCSTLYEVDQLFLDFFCQVLGITTPLLRAADFNASGKATDRLLDLCRQRGATSYLSGPAAKVYLDVEKFTAAGVDVRWVDYSGYPEYKQLHGAFEHGVSIVDLVLNMGPRARDYLKALRTPENSCD